MVYYQHHIRARGRAHPTWVEHVTDPGEATQLGQMLMEIGEGSPAYSLVTNFLSPDLGPTSYFSPC